jgi:hypothetical protein
MDNKHQSIRNRDRETVAAERCIDVTAVARRHGFTCEVYLTQVVWYECVENDDLDGLTEGERLSVLIFDIFESLRRLEDVTTRVRVRVDPEWRQIHFQVRAVEVVHGHKNGRERFTINMATKVSNRAARKLTHGSATNGRWS